jgi:hypothetical protein
MGDASWRQCGASVRKSLKRFLDKTLENVGSMKFYVIVIASALLWVGKLDAEYWFYAITICVATRNLVEIASVVKDVKSMRYGPAQSEKEPPRES